MVQSEATVNLYFCTVLFWYIYNMDYFRKYHCIIHHSLVLSKQIIFKITMATTRYNLPVQHYNLRESKIYVRVEVPTVVTMKSSIFWDITPCSPVNWHFRSKQCLHFQGWRACQTRNQHENWGEMFLWNTSWLSLDYTTLYSRRQNSSS
jgi:hypothetical protein